MSDALGALELAIDDLNAAQVVAILSKKAAYANELDSDGQPLLSRAIFASDPQRPDESLALVLALLRAGARPSHVDPNTGESAIHVAASKLKREPTFAAQTLEALLDALDEHPDDLIDADGLTPLAVVVGQSKQMSMSAPNDAEAERAMALAARLLVEQGSCCIRRRSGSSNQTAQHARLSPTILHEAAEWAPPAVLAVMLLADDVEDAMATADVHGNGPLQVALSKGQRAAALAILEAFPDACEGPWGGAGTKASRSLPAALHRMVEGAIRSPCAPLQRPDYASCVRILVERKGAPVSTCDASGRTPLVAALAGGAPLPLVHELLRYDTPLEIADHHGRCALMYAAQAADVDALRVILSNTLRAGGSSASKCSETPGCSSTGVGVPRVESADHDGMTALMLAARTGSADAVSLLIGARADVLACDTSGRSAILYATTEKPLLESGVTTKGSDICKLLRLLTSPPEAACEAMLGQVAEQTVQAITSSGTVISEGVKAAALMSSMPDSSGQCALALAAAGTSTSTGVTPFDVLCNALSASGVDVGMCGGAAVISLSCLGDASALQRLLNRDVAKKLTLPRAEQPSVEACSKILASRISPSVPSAPLNKPSALWSSAAIAAASMGHQEALGALLVHDAAAATTPAGKNLDTPLIAAASSGSADCVKLLLSVNVDAGVCNAVGENALMRAAGAGAESCVEVLLEATGDHFLLDQRGRSALAHAARGGNVRIVQLLYEAAPEMVNSVDLEGATPVIVAAAGGFQEAVEFFSACGVSLDLALDVTLAPPPVSVSDSAVHLDSASKSDRSGEVAGKLGSEVGALQWDAKQKLEAAVVLTRSTGGGMLVWRALRLFCPPELLALLLRELQRTGELAREASHRVRGRGLLHTAVDDVFAGKLTDAHATTLAEGMPEAELLAMDDDGLSVIGYCLERGMDELAIALETRIFQRLHALVEIMHAPEHQLHAHALATKLHSYWPQLEIRATSQLRRTALHASMSPGLRGGVLQGVPQFYTCIPQHLQMKQPCPVCVQFGVS